MDRLASRMSRLFQSKPTQYDDTPEGYLELTKKCLDRAQKRTLPKFNGGQCEFLSRRLNGVVESADSYLKALTRVEKIPNLEIFQLLYLLSQVGQTFMQSCCCDAWIETALTLTDVWEHISSISFNLLILTLAMNETNVTLISVEEVFEFEVQTLKKIASLDEEGMLGKLYEYLKTKMPTSREYQLADLLRVRLERSSINEVGDLSGSSQPSFSEILGTSLKQLERLGKGSAATVYRAQWLGVEVAKKTFYGPNFPDFEKEVSILVRLSHPNITPLLCYTKDYRECSIVMELMEEDLFSLIQRRLQNNRARDFPFDILEAIDIMLQIGSGMLYLHEMKIVHRDLKALNILVKCIRASGLENEYVLAKVADFGLSKIKDRSMTYSDQTLNMGTTRWMAPELMKIGTDESQAGTSNSEAIAVKFPYKSDVYSYAMVCYEILSGHQPFASVSSPNDVKKMVLNGKRPQLPKQCPVLLKALINRCWSPDAIQRPNFRDICVELRHLRCALLFHGAGVSNLLSMEKVENKSFYVVATNAFQGEDEEELNLSVGDEVLVRAIISSGWALGLCNGQSGWFPSSYAEKKRFYATTTHVFEGKDYNELTLELGDEVLVREVTSCGWSEGVCNGKSGWFPSDHVENHSSDARREKR